MIREYNESDYNIVNVLGRDVDPLFRLNFSPVSKCFVYEVDEEVVGFIIADIFDDRAEIIDICKNNKCDNITLEVKIDNKPALKLYKNNEFKIVSVRKKYYKDGNTDAYLMQRKF